MDVSAKILIVENEESVNCAQLFAIPNGMSWDEANDLVKQTIATLREKEPILSVDELVKELSAHGISIPEYVYADFYW